MKFMLTFDWSPDSETRAEGVERFKRTGGQPPQGVKLLGRWTRADFSGGFDLLETDDAQKLFEFAYMWGDLMEIEIIPVLDDKELSAALDSAVKWIAREPNG
jgi:Protein of unknown function (DUF3303)